MGLSQALSTAMSGLRATQASLSLVSSNVANAETPGYVRKTTNQVTGLTGDYGSSVLINGVNRQLDQYLQTQVRTEMSGATYSAIRSTYLSNLQSIYGNPGDSGTIESAFNNLLTAVQGLSTSPDSQSARIGVVNAAQSMAQQLNATTQGIQNLRANAETGLNESVNVANNAMAQIAAINIQLQNNGKTDAATASLLDQRDQYIDQLSQLMDIRTVTNDLNQVTVFTNSGVQLVGTEAARLSFNPQGTMTPNTLYNTDPTKNNVGTITINFPHGGSYDMVSTNSIRSGKIAAYLELRDNTLVQAQAQIDQFAASMSSALSDKTTNGIAAPSSVAPQAGFDLDLAGMKSGNVIHITYKDNLSGVTHNLSIVRVDDPSCIAARQFSNARSERRSAGRRFLRRHGLGDLPAQCRAGCERQSAVLQSIRHDAAGARRWRREPLGCAGGFSDDDDVVAHQRQCGTSFLHRQRRAVLGRDHGKRLAADRPCRPHQRQQCAGRRSLAHHRLFDQPAYRIGRYDALRLHPQPVDDQAIIAIRRRPASAPRPRRSPARWRISRGSSSASRAKTQPRPSNSLTARTSCSIR